MKKVWQIEKKFTSGKWLFFQFAFMCYFYYVNNYKLKTGSKLVLDLMLLKSFCFGCWPHLGWGLKLHWCASRIIFCERILMLSFAFHVVHKEDLKHQWSRNSDRIMSSSHLWVSVQLCLCNMGTPLSSTFSFFSHKKAKLLLFDLKRRWHSGLKVFCIVHSSWSPVYIWVSSSISSLWKQRLCVRMLFQNTRNAAFSVVCNINDSFLKL